MTNEAAAKHHVPLTKCHLQKLDSRKNDCGQVEKYSNGYCHYENGTAGFKKDAKER